MTLPIKLSTQVETALAGNLRQGKPQILDPLVPAVDSLGGSRHSSIDGRSRLRGASIKEIVTGMV